MIFLLGALPTTCQGQQIMPGSTKRNAAKFNGAQIACLNAYYLKGMAGVEKKYSSIITRTAKDTKLSVSQVKVTA